ncbi:hypothetical protein HU200_027953 [Digitaria exilis]|uniref:Uncharacterized protein n=1 Tax=Digitaria exilis TaxID=1010633 RepID=A0A835EQD0_9POAL|nr:hypothetical protein HU200_027953 [Digitaria exilis]
MCPRLRILKYDLGGHGRLSMVVDVPKLLGKVAPIDIDGRLGLVEYHRNCIYTWSRQADGVGGGWVWHNAAELETLIPTRRYSLYRDRLHDVIRLAEGIYTIIFSLGNNIDR